MKLSERQSRFSLWFQALRAKALLEDIYLEPLSWYELEKVEVDCKYAVPV